MPLRLFEIGEGEPAARLLDLAVRGAHVEVGREVEVAALAPDLQAAATRADGHAGRAALKDLRERKGLWCFGDE